MSFIYQNKDLIAELLKSANDYENKFNKLAQQPAGQAVIADPRVNEEYRSYLTLSNKLADNLAQEYSGAGAPGGVNVGGEASDMTVPDMNSLGNFFQFIAQHQITVDNQRVVYFANEQPPDLKNWLGVNSVERSIINMETQDQQGQRQALTADFYVNKALLMKYFQSLNARTAQEDEKTQLLIKALLGYLAEQINKMFGTQLSTEYKEPEKTLPVQESLTSFPDVLDYDNYSKDGNKELTWGDIADPNAIRKWAHDKTISILVDKHPIPVNDQKFDYCYVVRTLYAKAVWLLRNQSTADTQFKYQSFVKQMEKVGPSMQGPDGKQCRLGGAGGAAGQGGTKPTNVSPQALSNVVARLPFSVRDIDFGRIRLFFEQVSPLLDHVPQAGSYMSATEAEMQSFSTNLTQHGSTVIPLGMQPRQFVNMLKSQNPKDKEATGSAFAPALISLNKIIDNTRAVVDLFYSQYGENLGANQRAYVLGQIGQNPTDSSIYSRNSDELETLRTAARAT